MDKNRDQVVSGIDLMKGCVKTLCVIFPEKFARLSLNSIYSMYYIIVTH